MEQAIFWGGLAILVIFLGIGLLAGLIRGVKRSGLHLLFLVCAIVLSFLITKPITSAILGISFSIDGKVQSVSAYILSMLEDSFEISKFPTARALAKKLPVAIASPIFFIVVTLATFLVLDIIYLIVARISLGKKKKDFEKHKPHRWYGALIGAFEGLLFMIVLFAPLTCLTQTYEQIASASAVVSSQNDDGGMKPLSEYISETMPKELDDALKAYNKSALGRMSGILGIDDLLFDGLSSFKINGEKVVLRSELVSLANIYREFYKLYQKVDAGDYDINISTFKVNVNKFISSGLFRGVICELAKEYIVNAEFKESDENYDFMITLQETFSQPKFNAKNYISHDLKGILEAADDFFDSRIIVEYNELEKKETVEVLELVASKSHELKSVAKEVLNLNIVEDHLATFLKYASEQISKALSEKAEDKIELNPNISDKNGMLDQLDSAISEFLDLNKLVSISDLMKSDDIVATLYAIDDIDEIFTKLGSVFDTIREIEIFVHEGESEEDTKYVFDDILRILGLKLLGDEVTTPDGGKQKLSSYSLFFDHIKTPVMNAKALGLNDLSDFDAIINAICSQDDVEFLANTLMPFYELTVMDINKLVFEEVVGKLDENLKQVDFENVEKTYEGWRRELVLFGQILNVKDAQGKAYVKHLIDEDMNLQDLLKTIVAEKNLENLLNPIFEAASFKPLIADIFKEIDGLIEKVTKINPNTNSSKASQNDVSDLVSLMEIMLDENVDMSNLDLNTMGQILNIIKINAYNNGAEEKGVLNNIFASLVWYITGDNINGGAYSGEKLENSDEIKKFLNVNLEENPDGYYEIDFSVLSLVSALVQYGVAGSTELTGENVADFVNNLNNALESLNKEDSELAGDLNTLADMLESQGSTFATYDEEVEEALKQAISKSGFGEDVKTALSRLLNLN